MTIHKRCEKNVAKNCGINTKDLAERLKELGLFGKKVSLLCYVCEICAKFHVFIGYKFGTNMGS